MNFWQKLPHGFTVLAPMEGVTDVVFRAVVTKAGAPDVFFTEFTNVSSYSSEKGRHNALERLDLQVAPSLTATLQPKAIPQPTTAPQSIPQPTTAPQSETIQSSLRAPNSTPVVAQIWGKNPAHFAETASALQNLGFAGLDINMGCPDRHVNKAGGGAAMIQTPELALECIASARTHTALPVSVKTRLGYSKIDEFRTWLPLLLEQNLAALTVHLRTKKEMSKVPAHYELIPEIIKLRDEISPETVLIINGDIKDLAAAQKLSAQYPGVDGFMIGRGVFENPYCFTVHEPSQQELLALFLYHLDLFDLRERELQKRYTSNSARTSSDVAYANPDAVCAKNFYPYEPLKHFFKIYVHGSPGAAELRTKLMDCRSTAELRQVLSQ